MISADSFITQALKRGFDFYTGVPCSFLTSLINGVIGGRGLDYIGAASEGEAVAIAAGAWLAGRRTVVMCQNSGLGNAVNPLTSLNAPFRIPTLLVTTWRGRPGIKDEPQHALMGEITPGLLDLIRVGHRPFPITTEDLAPALDHACAEMERTGLPFAFVMAEDSVAPETLRQTPPPPRPPGERRDFRTGAEPPARAAVLERLLTLIDPEAAVVATTGKCGRELFTLDDREQHLYQVGSMGGAAGMALGLALSTPRPVVVLDGDGAALMKLGTLATIGAYRPSNLIHVLLDNGVHDSTGGQATVSPLVDFPGVALACGYPHAADCDGLDGFETAFKAASRTGGPSFIHVRIAPGSMAKLGRPTVPPHEVARRFKSFVTRPLDRPWPEPSPR
jgi:phosphonopyruvate decarboxylase